MKGEEGVSRVFAPITGLSFFWTTSWEVVLL